MEPVYKGTASRRPVVGLKGIATGAASRIQEDAALRIDIEDAALRIEDAASSLVTPITGAVSLAGLTTYVSSKW